MNNERIQQDAAVHQTVKDKVALNATHWQRLTGEPRGTFQTCAAAAKADKVLYPKKKKRRAHKKHINATPPAAREQRRKSRVRRSSSRWIPNDERRRRMREILEAGDRVSWQTSRGQKFGIIVRRTGGTVYRVKDGARNREKILTGLSLTKIR